MRIDRVLAQGIVLLAFAWAVAPARSENPLYTPQTGLQSGTEISLYFFTASDCGYCRQPKMIAAVKKARDLVAAGAKREGKLFAFRGVALDSDLERGLATLKEVGPLDEISVGRSSFNTANIALRLTSGIPQNDRRGVPVIVLFQRQLLFDKRGESSSEPKFLGSIIGTGIPAWADDGAPVPP